MALIAIAIIGALSMTVPILFRSFNAQSKHYNSVVGARSLISTMQGFVAYPTLCIANLDPSSRTFDPVQAASATGIPMSIQLGSGNTGPKVEAGSKLQNYDVEVDYLQYRRAAVSGADPAVAGNRLYSGELVMKLKKSGAAKEVAGGNELRERGIGTMILSVNSTTNLITGCYTLADARQACTEVGGTYDDATTPKCKLPYPCDAIPNAIFMGYDAANKPQCKTMSQLVGAICPSGQYLVSDGQGGTSCRAP
jgi:hypothetical protein